ncbi:MAG: molybdopterin-dependent oxidoreductase [Slackia sp.]|nr:molybdopterin-dependent oxidoreductase [Slackia sp.]
MPCKKTKAVVSTFGLAFALAASIGLAGCADPQQAPESTTDPDDEVIANMTFDDKIGSKIGYSDEGRLIDNINQLPEVYSHEEEEAVNAENNPPETRTDRNGFTIQPVPADDKGYNTTWLDGDDRGCLSCHDTLEDSQMNQPTYHRLIMMGYPSEQSVQNCLMCHNTWQPNANKLKDNIHQTHLNNDLFNEKFDGNCMSCHAIDDNGDFALWDVVKYDQYKGYVNVSAEDAALDVSYDQDTITPLENQFYKSIKSEPSEWTTDDTQIDPSVYENWTIELKGEVGNPFTMTLPELKEKFGTVTETLKAHCNVNGTGQATIFQAEVTGIPLKDVIEYAQPNEGTNGYTPKGNDGFGNLMPLECLEDAPALLVLEVNGQTLRPSQGYPVAVWVGGGAAAAEFPKYVTSINITTEANADKLWTHPRHGSNVSPSQTEDADLIFFPNAGVLNYPTGVVLENQVGSQMTLEGYADAYHEPIAKVEYSLDGGKTWTTMETPGTDVNRWVYWRMNFTPQEAGSYHLKVRAYSQLEDGSLHEPYYTTDYQFTVK